MSPTVNVVQMACLRAENTFRLLPLLLWAQFFLSFSNFLLVGNVCAANYSNYSNRSFNWIDSRSKSLSLINFHKPRHILYSIANVIPRYSQMIFAFPSDTHTADRFFYFYRDRYPVSIRVPYSWLRLADTREHSTKRTTKAMHKSPSNHCIQHY